MSVEYESASTVIPIDLPGLSLNFPPRPAQELVRDNVINTLQDLVKDTVYAASVEGPDGIGKTIVLSQFVRRFPSTAISVFVSASNRLSFDTDLIRKDIAIQAHWVLKGEVLEADRYDPLLLKSYYGDLQRYAKHSRSTIYFVLDGIHELDRPAGEQLLQQLADMLPIGIPQFRFLLSGDDGLYKGLFGRNLAIKSYPLTIFSAEEARAILDGHGLEMEAVNDLNLLCRGIPGRLASVRRALARQGHPRTGVSPGCTSEVARVLRSRLGAGGRAQRAIDEDTSLVGTRPEAPHGGGHREPFQRIGVRRQELPRPD